MSEQVWYYSQHGERKGPVTLEVLQNALAHGKIDIATDLVWGPGLPEWVKVHEVPELQGMTEVPDTGAPTTPPPVTAPTPAADSSMSNIVPPSQVKAARAAENPYASPDSDNALQEAMAARKGGEYPGMGRLGYYIWNIFLFCIYGGAYYYAFATALAGDSVNSGYSMLVAQVLAVLLPVFVILPRLRNVGMSRWNYFWSWLPIANIWLWYRLSVCPAGYHQHKKLDTAGKVLLSIHIILFIGFFGICGLFVFASKYKQAAEQAAQKVEEQQALQETSE